MNGVRVVRRLFWRGASPLLPSGALDTEALARALARSHYGSTRRFYSRAQHAVVLSRGVERVAEHLPWAALDDAGRGVIAMQAWLADMRAVWLLGGGPKRLGGMEKTVLSVMDVEGLARMLASVCRWSAAGAAHSRSAHGKAAPADLPPRGAAEFERRLRRPAELGDGERRRLDLYALLGEAVTAGLGVEEGEAVMAAAGLEPRIPEGWADSLGLLWRMADNAVRRDVGGAERPAFPALKDKIQPLEREAAARYWLDRYEKLNPAAVAAARGRTAARGTSAARGRSENTDKGESE